MSAAAAKAYDAGQRAATAALRATRAITEVGGLTSYGSDILDARWGMSGPGTQEASSARSLMSADWGAPDYIAGTAFGLFMTQPGH